MDVLAGRKTGGLIEGDVRVQARSPVTIAGYCIKYLCALHVWPPPPPQRCPGFLHSRFVQQHQDRVWQAQQADCPRVSGHPLFCALRLAKLAPGVPETRSGGVRGCIPEGQRVVVRRAGAP